MTTSPARSSCRTAALALLAATVSPAQTWATVTTNGPSPRIFAGASHDPSADTTLLFGGFDGATTFDDTWRLSGSTWTRLNPTTVPTERDSQVMAHDTARGRTVMFGGWDTAGTTLADTWEWNGSNWLRRTPANAPSPRLDAGMVYDSARGVCVLFGGYEPNSGVGFDETWEWNGTNWTRIQTATRPAARDGFACAYDAARGRTVVFGGWDSNNFAFADTWEYDGQQWTLVPTATAPSARFYTSMSYDAARGRCVLFGGQNNGATFGDTWEYDGTSWTRVSTGAPLGPRSAQAMVYQPSASRTLLFGGADAAPAPLGDTWAYRGTAPASYSVFGAGCSGSAGVPALVAVGTPTRGGSFSVEMRNLPAGPGLAYMVLGFSDRSWNGQPLPLNLAPFGLSAACNALVSADDGFVLTRSAGVARWTTPIPASASLAGLVFFNQGASFDPGAPRGLAFSNGGRGQLDG